MEDNICEYCTYRVSWDCADGYNRRDNCGDFSLDWERLSAKQKEYVKTFLERGY